MNYKLRIITVIIIPLLNNYERFRCKGQKSCILSKQIVDFDTDLLDPKEV